MIKSVMVISLFKSRLSKRRTVLLLPLSPIRLKDIKDIKDNKAKESQIKPSFSILSPIKKTYKIKENTIKSKLTYSKSHISIANSDQSSNSKSNDLFFSPIVRNQSSTKGNLLLLLPCNDMKTNSNMNIKVNSKKHNSSLVYRSSFEDKDKDKDYHNKNIDQLQVRNNIKSGKICLSPIKSNKKL